MYAVSDEYKAAIRAPTRTDRVRGTLTLTDGTVLALTDADLMNGSLTIDNQCVTGEELQVGCAYLGQAAFRLKTDIDRYKLYGAAAALHYELLLPGGTWETVPLGVFTVAEAERHSGYVAVKAYDNVLALQKAYSGVALQGTAYEIVSQIAAACGLTPGQTEEELLALNPNAALHRQLDGSYHVTTWRDCAAAVAQLLGGFVTVDRAGRLVIRPFAAESSQSLPASARTAASVSDYACRTVALHIETGAGEYTAATADENAAGLAMTITDMPLAESGLPAVQQAICDNLFAALDAVRYTPAEIKLTGDPAIELGDRIALPMADGAAPETLVTHLVWKYHGGQTVKGVGKNPHLSGTTTRTETSIRRLQNESIANRTIYYGFTNTAALTVAGDGKEVRAVGITYAATQDTTALFLAQLLLTAAPDTVTETLAVEYEKAEETEETGTDASDTGETDGTEAAAPTPAHVTLTRDAALTLTVRYYLNDVLLADFVPRQVLARGAHTLTLFYPFDKLTGGESGRFSVRLACTGGQVTIAKNNIKATISGQGLAGGDAWDGTLSCEDALPAPALTTPAVTVAAPAEAMQCAAQAAAHTALEAVRGAITLARPAVTLPLTADAPTVT